MDYKQWLKVNEERLRDEWKKEENKKFLLVFVIDRSGSMQGKEADVVGGINKLLEEQKKLDSPAKTMFVRFNSGIEMFREMQDLQNCKYLTMDEYFPGGSTSLLDAIGQTIVATDMHVLLEKPARTIFVIVTDGQENTSVVYKKKQISDMITEREKNGWGFIFLGANVDAFAEAQSLGIRFCNTSNYTDTKEGTFFAYTSVSDNIYGMRCCVCSTAAGLGGTLGEDCCKH